MGTSEQRTLGRTCSAHDHVLAQQGSVLPPPSTLPMPAFFFSGTVCFCLGCLFCLGGVHTWMRGVCVCVVCMRVCGCVFYIPFVVGLLYLVFLAVWNEAVRVRVSVFSPSCLLRRLVLHVFHVCKFCECVLPQPFDCCKGCLCIRDVSLKNAQICSSPLRCQILSTDGSSCCSQVATLQQRRFFLLELQLRELLLLI